MWRRRRLPAPTTATDHDDDHDSDHACRRSPGEPDCLHDGGIRSSNEEVAPLLARLRLLPMLSNVTLGSTGNVSGATGKSYVTFSLTASIQHPPTGTGL